MMREYRRGAAIVFLLAVLAGAAVVAQQRPVFRSSREIVSVDVIVRDRNGNIVRGLTQSDFEIREDGQAQDLLTFTFQEIADKPPVNASPPPELLSGVEMKMAEPMRSGAATEAPAPMTSEALAGRRLIVLLFDVS